MHVQCFLSGLGDVHPHEQGLPMNSVLATPASTIDLRWIAAHRRHPLILAPFDACVRLIDREGP